LQVLCFSQKKKKKLQVLCSKICSNFSIFHLLIGDLVGFRLLLLL